MLQNFDLPCEFLIRFVIMKYFLLSAISVTLVSAQTCNAPTIGPCFAGECPDPKNNFCLSEGPQAGNCCNQKNVVPLASPAPPGSCVDEVDPTTGISPCPNMSSLCTDKIYKPFLDKKCPVTCNTNCVPDSTTTITTITTEPTTTTTSAVTTPAASSSTTVAALTTTAPAIATTTVAVPPACSDLTTQCLTMTSYCTNNIYYDLMTQQCPFTCGRCALLTTTAPAPLPACVDKINPSTGVSDCPGMASYCNNPTYKNLMTDQCPSTCGLCSGVGNSVVCVDKINPNTGSSDCPGMLAYCSNPTYASLMKDQCPKTCGFCASG